MDVRAVARILKKSLRVNSIWGSLPHPNLFAGLDVLVLPAADGRFEVPGVVRVIDFLQGQALRWGGHSRVNSVAGLEGYQNIVGLQLSASDFGECSGDDSDHVFEEGGAFDNDSDVGSVFEDFDFPEFAFGGQLLTVGGAKCRKIVFSDEMIGRDLHQFGVERMSEIPGALDEEGVGKAVVPDAVFVAFTAGVVSGVKGAVHELAVVDADGVWGQGVEATDVVPDGAAFVEGQGGDLS